MAFSAIPIIIRQGAPGGVEGGDADTLQGNSGSYYLNSDNHTAGVTNTVFLVSEKTKLAGVATGATANDTDANLKARANHTGTQSADSIVDGTANKVFTAAEKTKLSGVATGATANATDAQLRDRSTHTGTQSADSITDGATNKAFTATEKTKLAGVATGATVNEKASDVEVTAGVENTKFVTPAQAKLAAQTFGGSSGGSSSASGSRLERSVAQAAHGLAAKNWVRLAAGSYVKGQANSADNAEVLGMVREATDANNFVLATSGYVTGLSGLSVGLYFLDPAVAGGMTQTEPVAGQVSRPVFFADSTSSGYILHYRPVLVVDAPAGTSSHVVLTDAATIALDAALSNSYEVSSATNRTLGIPTGAAAGRAFRLRWRNTDAAPHTLTPTTSGAGAFRYTAQVTSIPATPAGGWLMLGCAYDSVDNKWDIVSLSSSA